MKLEGKVTNSYCICFVVLFCVNVILLETNDTLFHFVEQSIVFHQIMLESSFLFHSAHVV